MYAQQHYEETMIDVSAFTKFFRKDDNQNDLAKLVPY